MSRAATTAKESAWRMAALLPQCRSVEPNARIGCDRRHKLHFWCSNECLVARHARSALPPKATFALQRLARIWNVLPRLADEPEDDPQMQQRISLKEIVAVLLSAVVPVYAQAQSSRAGRVSKGAAGGVPNWNVTSSCRAAGKVAYAQDASAREKSCMESENRTREKLAADWSTFPAADRIACVKSLTFSPTYTELATCLEMRLQLKNSRDAKPADSNPSQRK